MSTQWKNAGSLAKYDLKIPALIKGRMVLTIGENAFANVRRLNSVVIPSTVVSIGDLAFGGCNELTEVTIPDSVRDLGRFLFLNSSLQTIRLPASLTRISEDLFGNCDLLESILVEPANKYFSSVDGVLFDKADKILVAHPSGRKRYAQCDTPRD